MLKWMTDGEALKPVIPIAVGEDSIAFPQCTFKAGVDLHLLAGKLPGKLLIPGQPAGMHDVQLRVDLSPVLDGHFLLLSLTIFDCFV